MRSSAYIPLLRVESVRVQALTGLVSQLTQGAAGVGIVLVVRQHTGSLPLAGAVVGALSVAAGVARPVQGRLIDRRGSRSLLVACGIAHPVALIAIVGCSTVDALRWLLVVLGAAAGLALPPVSTSMRARWGKITAAGAERTAAYSLVYLVQELSILTGPLILAAVIAASSSSAALIVVAALAGAGTLGFARSIGEGRAGEGRDREGGTADGRAAEGRTAERGTADGLSGERPSAPPPPAVGHPPASHPPPAANPSPSHPPARSGTILRVPGVRAVLLIALLLGAVIGALEVAAPIFATSHGSPAAAGLLIAALSVGGIVGAAVSGSVRWRSEPAIRLILLLAVMTIWLGLTIPADSLLLGGALLLLAGVPLNPALATFSVLVDEHVAAGSAAEAFGWLSTALSGGTGAASAIAAAVAHSHDAHAAFVVAALAGLTATGVAGLASRWALAAPERGS